MRIAGIVLDKEKEVRNKALASVVCLLSAYGCRVATLAVSLSEVHNRGSVLLSYCPIVLLSFHNVLSMKSILMLPSPPLFHFFLVVRNKSFCKAIESFKPTQSLESNQTNSVTHTQIKSTQLLTSTQ